MERPRFVSLLLWMVLVLDGVRHGLSLGGHTVLRFNALGVALVIAPVIFFSVVPWLTRRHPMDVASLRGFVNARFGSGTYEAYIRAIRPLAMFSTIGFVTGSVALLEAWRVGAGEGAFVAAGFSLSAALGLALSRLIFRGRGDTTE
jgi:hypothetical protein